MTTKLVTVEMDDSLATVKEIFDNTGFHHLLVVECNKLVGIISDRDLLRAVSPKIDTPAATEKDLACLNKKVHQIMTSKLITLKSNSDIYDAIEVFNSHKISCLPIVDNEDKAIGILSWRDVFKILKRRK